ncbi:MAG: monovalent cation/H(+) antiporter subunit G [Propionibacterium sp.]|nr:monovalent cation/H(+) antiporter subunit G [Propionibacterium sp.]
MNSVALMNSVTLRATTAVQGPWLEVLDWAGAILLFIGVVFTLVAAIGLVRMRDLYSRMHAATKPQLLGLMFVCAGIALDTQDWRWVVLGIAVITLQVVTAPVGSHLVGRAVFRTRRDEGRDLVVDELSEDLSSSSVGDRS